MDEVDSNEMRLQDTQRPDMYRAGITLRSTFAGDDRMGSDLTALMLQLARLPDIGTDAEGRGRR